MIVGPTALISVLVAGGKTFYFSWFLVTFFCDVGVLSAVRFANMIRIRRGYEPITMSTHFWRCHAYIRCRCHAYGDFQAPPPKSYEGLSFFSQPTFSLKIMENGKFWQNENRREQCDLKKMIQNVQFFSKKCFFWWNHEHLFSNRWVKRIFIFIFLLLTGNRSHLMSKMYEILDKI